MNDSPALSFLIFRNGSIGNTIAAVPAIRAIRKRFAEAKLSVVVDPIGYDLLEFCPYIDQLVIYDKRDSDAGIFGFMRTLKRLRSLRPTHAVLFKRFFRNGLLAYLSGARVRAGFRTNGRAPFLNLTTDYDENVHVVDLNLRLAAQLGAEAADRNPELFLTDQDRAYAAEMLSGIAGDRFIAVHYGGLTTAPDFVPLDKFVSYLKDFQTQGFQIVLIGSGRQEIGFAGEIAQSIRVTKCLNLPIRTTAAIIERSDYFMGFNSGPMHIAGSLRKRGIVFFKPGETLETELVKWKPLNSGLRVVIPPATAVETDWTNFSMMMTRMVSDLTAQ